VVWLTEDEGTIDGGIHYQMTGAHSKYHQVFWIEAGGQKYFSVAMWRRSFSK
jgi:hypothetical protein